MTPMTGVADKPAAVDDVGGGYPVAEAVARSAARAPWSALRDRRRRRVSR